MAVEVPSDSARTRSIVIVAVVVAALVAVAAGVWVLIAGRNEGPPKQTEIELAEETSATTMPPVPGAQATQTLDATETSPETATTPAQPATSGPAKIAFRLGGSIYVANQDGSGAVAVATSTENYALSPDGKTLAIVPGELEQGTVGVVTLVDVATGAQRSVGSDAAAIAPSWAPDSSWLAYTGTKGTAWLAKGVGADGARDLVLAEPGARPVTSSDGTTIAYKVTNVTGLADPLMVHIASEKEARAVGHGDGALSWGWGPEGVLYFTRPGSDATKWEVWSWKRGSKSRRIGSVTLSAPAYTLSDMTVSSDGKYVVVAATGDDEYSRLWVLDVSAKRFSAIATRRDAYPSSWSSTGRLLYFEGNAYQGEPSALMSILPDGTERRMVVSGAQR